MFMIDSHKNFFEQSLIHESQCKINFRQAYRKNIFLPLFSRKRRGMAGGVQILYTVYFVTMQHVSYDNQSETWKLGSRLITLIGRRLDPKFLMRL